MKSLIIILCLGLVAELAVAYPQPQEGDVPPADSMSPKIDPDVFLPDTIEDNNSNSTSDSDSDSDYSDDDDDDDESPASISSSMEANSNETEIIPDAPAEVPEEVMDIEGLKSMVYEFTNLTSGFNTADLLTRLGVMEANIRKTTSKLSQDLENERQKLSQLSSLLSNIAEIKGKLTDFETRMSALSSGVGNLGKIPRDSPFPVPYDTSRSGDRQTSWATLYRSSGHSGRTYELDFRTCSIYEECCKNLGDLDNDTQSIHTHDTCVKMYKDRGCIGESREFYPGSTASHSNFGSYNDVFSSGKPCNSS